MAYREARLRLTLVTGGFLGGLQQLTSDVQRESVKIETSLSKAFKGGIGAAKESFGKMKSELSNVGKWGLALGGGLEIGNAAKDALQMQGEYKRIAYRIEAATAQAVKWEGVQKEIEETAMRWSRKNGEVAASYDTMFTRSGNAEFAAHAVEAVAIAAQAAKEPMDAYSETAAQLNKVFGITAQQMPAALAGVTALAGKGADLSELNTLIMRTGASAKILGLEGSAGFQKLSGMLNVVVKSGVQMRQATSGLNEVMGDLADPTKMKSIQEEIKKKFHKNTHLVNKRGGVTSDALFQIMSATGGDSAKLKGLFPSVGGAALMAGIGDIYKRNMALPGASRDSARKATEEALTKLGESALTASRQQEEAQKNNETAHSQMLKAMNELENEFAKPEMIGALKQLAHIMPKVAHGAAKLLEFTVNHPALAAVGYVGARGAAAGVGGLASTGLQMAGTTLGQIIAAEFSKTTSVQIKTIGSMGETIMQTVQRPGPWQNVGKIAGAIMGTAAGAILAYEAGTWLIDKAFEKSKPGTEGAMAVANSGQMSVPQLADALKKAKAESDQLDREGGVFNRPKMKAAHEAVEELQKELDARQKVASQGIKAAGGLEKMNLAIEGATKRLDKIGKRGSSNGLPGEGDNTPGYDQ